jgi:hypothetical protein
MRVATFLESIFIIAAISISTYFGVTSPAGISTLTASRKRSKESIEIHTFYYRNSHGRIPSSFAA